MAEPSDRLASTRVCLATPPMRSSERLPNRFRPNHFRPSRFRLNRFLRPQASDLQLSGLTAWDRDAISDLLPEVVSVPVAMPKDMLREELRAEACRKASRAASPIAHKRSDADGAAEGRGEPSERAPGSPVTAAAAELSRSFETATAVAAAEAAADAKAKASEEAQAQLADAASPGAEREQRERPHRASGWAGAEVEAALDERTGVLTRIFQVPLRKRQEKTPATARLCQGGIICAKGV